MTEKTFEQLQTEILTAYRNQFPNEDASAGTLLFIRAATLSGVLWGLYQHQSWVKRQIFIDTAEGEFLDHHGWVLNITRLPGETDDDYRARLLDRIRRPPAGGNKYDYPRWALEVEGVKAAYCFGGESATHGIGTVDVLVLASGVSEIPDQTLKDAVLAYI
ncbi:MAG TPA: baseplate J/gp47 family protein, partial [Elusimicrobiales bacterium]|nr:baseplate J/gp47 family protein [Elusimicrobiales bacterium]